MAQNEAENDAEDYEAQHVHSVYEKIASHFSSTRYKPWPIVERFLLEQAPGSIGLDIGCGNGKYLSVNRNVFIIASDRSQNLAEIARARHGHASVLAADALAPPHPDGAFDFALSIAVIHHLSTRARRVEAIHALLRTLKSPRDSKGGRGTGRGGGTSGKALVFVWALEQRESRRGWDSGDAQDVMVPWVLKGQKRKEDGAKGPSAGGQASVEGTGSSGCGGEPEQVLHRYYHLYSEGELESDIRAADGHVLESGYDRDNWWAVAERAPDV